MTMKQIKLCRAYEALDGFAKNIHLPATKAFAIYTVIKKVRPIYEARVDVERDIINRFDIKVDNGQFTFKTPAFAEAYMKEIDELNNVDVEVNVSPIVIALDDIGEQRITPAQMEALDGIICFE